MLQRRVSLNGVMEYLRMGIYISRSSIPIQTTAIHTLSRFLKLGRSTRPLECPLPAALSIKIAKKLSMQGPPRRQD